VQLGLQLGLITWSQTQIVAFENDFAKRQFNESFFINTRLNIITEKASDLFSQLYKATFGRKVVWIVDCILWLRFSVQLTVYNFCHSCLLLFHSLLIVISIAFPICRYHYVSQ